MTIALKKIWLWIVHHWKVVTIGALSIALLVVSRKHSKSLSKALQAQTEKYRAQMAELDKINNQANAEEREAVEDYITNIKNINEEQRAAFEALDEDKKKEVERIVEENLKDPETIDRLLQDKFGFRKV
tara:strand:+ start:2832 stop:3218 length:387 start_codon:yes stop_codon:yes gene_type:complete